jgi:uncharacterized repeat protein (TIGR03803 family)
MSDLEPLSISRRALCAAPHSEQGSASPAGPRQQAQVPLDVRLSGRISAGHPPHELPASSQQRDLNKLYVSTTNEAGASASRWGGGSSPRYNVWISTGRTTPNPGAEARIRCLRPACLWPPVLRHRHHRRRPDARVDLLGAGGQAAPRARARRVSTRMGSQGTHPMGGLIKGFDGAMYGTTSGGGAHGIGNVFRVTTAGELRRCTTSIRHCRKARGRRRPSRPARRQLLRRDQRRRRAAAGRAVPHGARWQQWTRCIPSTRQRGGRSSARWHSARTARLYGVTSEGGKHRGGTLFALATDGSVEILHHFNAEDAWRRWARCWRSRMAPWWAPARRPAPAGTARSSSSSRRAS